PRCVLRRSVMEYMFPAFARSERGIEGSADLRAAELSAQRGDLGHREHDVQRARRRDVAVEVVHVQRVVAEAGLEGVEPLGLKAMELVASVCGGHDDGIVTPPTGCSNAGWPDSFSRLPRVLGGGLPYG